MDKIINTHGTLIIAGFPGVGKTFCTNNKKLQKKYKMADSDSSCFSHIYKNKIKLSNPNFPDNYIDHIKSYFGVYDIVFISTHEIVRETLREEKIPYILVYPENTLNNKTKYISKYQKRGNDSSFIKFIVNNWDNFLDDMFIESWPVHYELKEDKTLFDVIDYIYEVNSFYTSSKN